MNISLCTACPLLTIRIVDTDSTKFPHPQVAELCMHLLLVLYLDDAGLAQRRFMLYYVNEFH